MVARTKSRPVVLDPADRQMLTALVRTGSHPAVQVRRARILLELDENDPGRVEARVIALACSAPPPELVKLSV